MQISLQQSKHLQAIAILMMLCLHLFNRDYHGLFQPLIFIGSQPLSYYISLFSDACVPIFAFVSGYGLYFKYIQNNNAFKKDNINRIKKLYVNYWIILVLFAVGLGLLLDKEGYPGSFTKILSNISGLNTSYNGAWWFFTTYIFFVVTARFWFNLMGKVKPWFYLLALFFIYLIAFYFRVYKANLFDNETLNWFQKQTVLYCCTLFQFMLGAFALKYNWNTIIANTYSKVKYKNALSSFFIISAIVFHGLIPNFIVAPFTALIFIFAFNQMKIPSIISKALDFFAIHATNTWLIHMFFYMTFFESFVYGFKYIPLIFLILLFMCIASSYVVNFINTQLQKIT